MSEFFGELMVCRNCKKDDPECNACEFGKESCNFEKRDGVVFISYTTYHCSVCGKDLGKDTYHSLSIDGENGRDICNYCHEVMEKALESRRGMFKHTKI